MAQYTQEKWSDESPTRRLIEKVHRITDMPKSPQIRIAIADDQPLIRSGLGAFLMVYDELQLVGEAQDGDEALQLCELTEPDIILLDIDMTTPDGQIVAGLIHQRWPQIKILLLMGQCPGALGCNYLLDEVFFLRSPRHLACRLCFWS